MSGEKDLSSDNILKIYTNNDEKMQKIGQVLTVPKSRKMILEAIKKNNIGKEKFIHTDIETWKYRGKFDFIFAMESLYYADSIEIALEKYTKC